MMNSENRYRCNEPDVIYEIYDDEVVVLNFNNGSYYSLKETARFIWILIVRGFTLSEIQQHFTDNNHKAAREQSISEFFGSLIANDLIVKSSKKNLKRSTLEEKEEEAREVDTEIFTPPLLEQYTEMQELLLLDPIHEVSHTGWPVRKKK